MQLQFLDGTFSIWCAHYGSWAGDARKIFRVREDRCPKQRAREKKIIHYDRILPATLDDTQRWLDSHPTYPIILKNH